MVIASKSGELLGVNVYLKPTYAFIMPARKKNRGPLTDLQRANLKNLKKNSHAGKLSKKAITKLVNSVNWLVASAKKKWVFDKSKNKYFSFKVNFVTLTLPAGHQEISDHKFKSVLLHNFINQCRYRYGLKNFVWKVEAQENGNIHAHFTTDTYLPWRGIRDVWNRILLKNGLLDLYRAKHSQMDFVTYCKTYNSSGEHSLKKMKKKFSEGEACDWTDPNSTDVHAVYKVKDIAAYLAKYMSKSDDERRPIKGRLWSCSYNISQANKLYVSLPFDMSFDAVDAFISGAFKFKEVFSEAKAGLTPKKIGELFFFKLHEMKHKIIGPIGDLYRETLFKIRNNIQMDFDQAPPDHEENKKRKWNYAGDPIKKKLGAQLRMFQNAFPN